MSIKLKKGSGDITIKIENNMFSKNKTSDKTDGELHVETHSRKTRLKYMTQVKSPYEPEPDFLGEIRTALANRRLYEMRINPRPGVYNNYDDAHMRSNALVVNANEDNRDENDENIEQLYYPGTSARMLRNRLNDEYIA